MTVPGNHACEVSIVARHFVTDVPYDGTLTTYYSDGTTSVELTSGVYEGVSVSDDHIQISDCLPI